MQGLDAQLAAEIAAGRQLAEAQGAGMAPTLLFFGPDGKRTLRAVGYQSPERFELILDYLIDGANQFVIFTRIMVPLACTKSPRSMLCRMTL